MLESVWLAIFAVSSVLAYLLFIERRDQVFLSILCIAGWAVLAYGATDIEALDGTIAHTEPAVSLLCVGLALLSLFSLPFTAFSIWEKTDEAELSMEDLPDDVRRALEQ